MGGQGGGKPRTAAADDQYVGIVINLAQVHIGSGDATGGLDLARHFLRGQIPYVGADPQGRFDLDVEVRMEVLKQLGFFFKGQFRVRSIQAILPCAGTLLNGRHHHCWVRHTYLLRYFDVSVQTELPW